MRSALHWKGLKSSLLCCGLTDLLHARRFFCRPNYEFGLRVSASRVLTATGFVNGRWQLSTPTDSTPLDRSPKNLVQMITSAAPTAVPNLVQTREGGSVQMGELERNVFIYLFILFSGTHLRVRPVDGFSRLIAQTTRTRARMCLLGVSLSLLPILGVKSPENTNFWGVNRPFKANGQNIESFMLSKLLHRFQPNLAQR